MTNHDILLSNTEAEIGREIIRLVPHWYEAVHGPEHYSIPIGSRTVRFCNHCRLTPALRTFLARIAVRTQSLPLEHFVNLPGLIDVLLESFAIEWLQMHSPSTDWVRFIKYLESIARRTYENQPVALNLIIRQGQGTGRHHAAVHPEVLRPPGLVDVFLPGGGQRPAADRIRRGGLVGRQGLDVRTSSTRSSCTRSTA